MNQQHVDECTTSMNCKLQQENTLMQLDMLKCYKALRANKSSFTLISIKEEEVTLDPSLGGCPNNNEESLMKKDTLKGGEPEVTVDLTSDSPVGYRPSGKWINNPPYKRSFISYGYGYQVKLLTRCIQKALASY